MAQSVCDSVEYFFKVVAVRYFSIKLSYKNNTLSEREFAHLQAPLPRGACLTLLKPRLPYEVNTGI